MPAKIESYRTWQQAMDLAVSIYEATRAWPKEELYGLTSRVRRAATSIPANIAGGYGRENRGSCQKFLRIAQGSLKELETHLLIAERTKITPEGSIHDLLQRCESLGKLLRLLIRKIAAT